MFEFVNVLPFEFIQQAGHKTYLSDKYALALSDATHMSKFITLKLECSSKELF